MKRAIITAALFLTPYGFIPTPCCAGVLKVATYPARHPFKSTKKVLSVATYPVRHPVKTVF